MGAGSWRPMRYRPSTTTSPVDVRVAEAQRDVADQVAVGVQRLGREGLLRVGDRVQHLVLDGDGGGGQPRGVGVVGGDGGDGLAVVADEVARRRRAGRRPGGRAPASPGTSSCVTTARTPGIAAAARGVDGDDAGVRVRGAQHRGPQQALGPQVGGVREGALGLGAGVGGRERGAEAVRRAARCWGGVRPAGASR